MKKFNVLIVLFFCCVYCFAQERWDSGNASYTNHTYSFHWNLPNQFVWKKSLANEKHTVFKALSDYGIIVFVNINSYEASTTVPDMWENFEKYKKLYEYSWRKTKERIGGNTEPIKIEKCRFAGANAIKLIARQSLKDDVIDETSYGITYNFHKDNAMWSVSLKCSEEVYKSVGEQGLKVIFRGFGMNAK